MGTLEQFLRSKTHTRIERSHSNCSNIFIMSATIRVRGVKDKPIELDNIKLQKLIGINFLAYLNHYSNPQLHIAAAILEFFSIKGVKNPEYAKFAGFSDRKCADPSYTPSSNANAFLTKISSNGVYFKNKNDISTKEQFVVKIQDKKFCKAD